MPRTKRSIKRKNKAAKDQSIYARRAVEHAAKLAQDFATVNDQIEKSRIRPEKLPQAIRTKVNKEIGSVIASGLSKRVFPCFSSSEDKTIFQNIIFNKICDLIFSTITQELFDALEQSFKNLVPKIQALDLASQHHNRYPAHSPVGTRAVQDADSILGSKVAGFSVDHEVADSMDDESIDDEKETSKQVVQPAIRLQGIRWRSCHLQGQTYHASKACPQSY